MPSDPFRHVVRRLLAARDDVLPRLVAQTLADLPHCHEASISVLGDRLPLSIGASGAPISRLADVQYRQCAGPAWEAMILDRPVVIGVAGLVGRSLGEAPDGWRDVAIAEQITGVLALPVPTPDDVAAVLSVYTRAPGGWLSSPLAGAVAQAARIGETLVTVGVEVPGVPRQPRHAAPADLPSRSAPMAPSP